MISASASFSTQRIKQYWSLTKPRVTQLTVFCTLIGMLLAAKYTVSWHTVLGGLCGIGLLSSAAFSLNCLMERRVDRLMQRTASRSSASGEIDAHHILIFATVLSLLGAGILYTTTNALTLGLTLATFIAYVVIYTRLLKPTTPQNIVIGGLSGAMPPALGWAAIAGEVSAQAWILVLIIFAWTPPHFWALALYRRKDYLKSGWPMLPITHGEYFTRLHILLYTLILSAVTLLPFACRMSGLIYLLSALVLDFYFLKCTWQLWKNYSDKAARFLFRYSIIYLALLFTALLLDHYFIL